MKLQASTKLEEPKRKVTLQDTVNSKVPPKKNVEKHIKIMSRTSSTHIYQATPKDSGASLKVNVRSLNTPFSVISIGPIVGWGLDLLSGIVLLSSLVLKTDENCLFRIFAFV
jgi:hypothetical protein